MNRSNWSRWILRIAVNAVGEIVGKTSTDDLLDSIFSQFLSRKIIARAVL